MKSVCQSKTTGRREVLLVFWRKSVQLCGNSADKNMEVNKRKPVLIEVSSNSNDLEKAMFFFFVFFLHPVVLETSGFSPHTNYKRMFSWRPVINTSKQNVKQQLGKMSP